MIFSKCYNYDYLDNCVLACYPCNNAKSDVFSYEEFLEIGKTIHKVKIQLDEPRDYKAIR